MDGGWRRWRRVDSRSGWSRCCQGMGRKSLVINYPFFTRNGLAIGELLTIAPRGHHEPIITVARGRLTDGVPTCSVRVVVCS